MNIATIISGIFAISKAIPQLKKWWDEAVEAIIQIKINQVKEEHKKKGAQLRAVHNSISRAETDEERLALSAVLYDLTNNK